MNVIRHNKLSYKQNGSLSLVPLLKDIKSIQELTTILTVRLSVIFSVQLSSYSEVDKFHFKRILIRCIIKAVA